jgi:hypothetical protein
MPNRGCTTGTEAAEVEWLKGDARMARVLVRAVASWRRAPTGDLEVGLGLRRLVLTAAQLDALVHDVAALGLPYAGGRALLRDKLARALTQVAGLEREQEIRRHPDVKRVLDHLWPSVTPVAVVADLLGRPERLARAAGGVLDADEHALLVRRRPRAWTVADGPLVDEARELVSGRSRGLRPGHRRRGPGPVADAAADARPQMPCGLDDAAGRPGPGHRRLGPRELA